MLVVPVQWCGLGVEILLVADHATETRDKGQYGHDKPHGLVTDFIFYLKISCTEKLHCTYRLSNFTFPKVIGSPGPHQVIAVGASPRTPTMIAAPIVPANAAASWPR